MKVRGGGDKNECRASEKVNTMTKLPIIINCSSYKQTYFYTWIFGSLSNSMKTVGLAVASAVSLAFTRCC